MKAMKRRSERQKMIVYVDPYVLAGQWTWIWTETGLTFKGLAEPPDYSKK